MSTLSGYVDYVRELADHDRMNVNAVNECGVEEKDLGNFEGRCCDGIRD